MLLVLLTHSVASQDDSQITSGTHLFTFSSERVRTSLAARPCRNPSEHPHLLSLALHPHRNAPINRCYARLYSHRISHHQPPYLHQSYHHHIGCWGEE